MSAVVTFIAEKQRFMKPALICWPALRLFGMTSFVLLSALNRVVSCHGSSPAWFCDRELHEQLPLFCIPMNPARKKEKFHAMASRADKHFMEIFV